MVDALKYLGYSVLLEKRSELTIEQRKYATKKIFSEPDILRQLEEAKEHMDTDMNYFSTEEYESNS